MYLQAGRGLAAAHRSGLVHRDFKPENVLVGDDDQRPRVLDFGLARIPGSTTDLSAKPADLSAKPAPSDLSPEPSNLSPEPSDPARLTTPGAVLGTPAYMAPEQLDGADADARSDLFSFCTALHEALHGVRPFAGATRTALRAAIARDAPARPRAGELPTWLQRVVERGLAADPWPELFQQPQKTPVDVVRDALCSVASRGGWRLIVTPPESHRSMGPQLAKQLAPEGHQVALEEPTEGPVVFPRTGDPILHVVADLEELGGCVRDGETIAEAFMVLVPQRERPRAATASPKRISLSQLAIRLPVEPSRVHCLRR